MPPARIHRIAVAVKDLDAAVEFYSTMLGATFERTGEAVSRETGVAVAADWNLGLEIMSPVPGSDNPIAQKIERFLAESGEGICGAAYVVDDMAAAIQRARDAGLDTLRAFSFTKDQLDAEFGGAFTRFEETVLDSTERCGATYGLVVLENEQ